MGENGVQITKYMQIGGYFKQKKFNKSLKQKLIDAKLWKIQRKQLKNP